MVFSLKSVARNALAVLCGAVLVTGAAWAAESVKPKAHATVAKAAEPRMNKKSVADAAIGKNCLSCHDKDEDPGIYAQWKGSKHAASNVDCYDCHKAKEGDKGALKHEGVFIQMIVTPKTCATCHEAEVAQQQRSHHAKGGNIIASVDNLLGEVIGGPAGDGVVFDG